MRYFVKYSSALFYNIMYSYLTGPTDYPSEHIMYHDRDFFHISFRFIIFPDKIVLVFVPLQFLFANHFCIKMVT